MKSLKIAATGIAVGALTLLWAAPATAAGNSIDPGDSLYAISCDNDDANWQLYGVESSTAVSTPIGSGTPDENESPCAGQAAYNPATGVSYYIQWTNELTVLASIDPATGVSTPIDAFYWNNGEFPEYIDADSLAIGGDGSAYILAEGSLFSVDLTSGIVELVSNVLPAGIYAFAWDSVTDIFYGIASNNTVYEIDVESGGTTVIGEIEFPVDDNEWRVYSLQFDEAGSLWIEVDQSNNSFFGATLWSLTLDTLGAPVYSGLINDGSPFYTESLLILPGTPEPVLAATGVEAAPVVAGALGLIVLGGAALVLRRRAA